MFAGLNNALSPVFILPFQAAMALGAAPFWAFAFGVLVLSLAATVIGELSMAGAYYLNRRHFAEVTKEMVTHNNLSIQAIAQQDKEAYKACNHMANEAFGLSFFSGIALFASSVWPAFFALGWLGHAFGDAEIILPVAGVEIGYHVLFIILYIVVRVLFAKLLKPRLWPFNRIEAWRKRNEYCGEDLKGWDSLHRPQE